MVSLKVPQDLKFNKCYLSILLYSYSVVCGVALVTYAYIGCQREEMLYPQGPSVEIVKKRSAGLIIFHLFLTFF